MVEKYGDLYIPCLSNKVLKPKHLEPQKSARKTDRILPEGNETPREMTGG